MSATPEQDKLKELDERLGILDRYVSWGPEGYKMSDEEKAAFIRKVMLDVEADMANTVSIPVSQLVDIADALHALSDLSTASVQEWMDMPKELAALKHKIGELADLPAMFAEQWLPNDL